MCTSFTCTSCEKHYFNRCTSCVIESISHCGQVTPISCTTCEPCERISGAIAYLEALVFKAPFLAEKGLSGIEDMQEWERPRFEELLLKKGRDWRNEAASLAGRVEMDAKIKAMRLDGVEDCREKDGVVCGNEVDDENDDPLARMVAGHEMNRKLSEGWKEVKV